MGAWSGVSCNEKGACFSEIIVALGAGLIVLASAVQSVASFQHRLAKQHALIAAHQDLRLGLEVLEEELRRAGTGGAPGEAPIIVAQDEKIEFAANVDGLMTHLTNSVSDVEQNLPVEDGREWRQGKRIMICSDGRCVDGKLAEEGKRGTLVLTNPTGCAFASGAQVFVSNRVRYYTSMSGDGKKALMRQIDGGVNPIIGDIRYLKFTYFTRDGAKTNDPAFVARVRIQVGVGDDHTMVQAEVALRNR